MCNKRLRDEFSCLNNEYSATADAYYASVV